LGVLVEEQDGGGVDPEDVLRSDQQLVEQRLEGQLGERRIGQPIDVLELARGRHAQRLVADPEKDLAFAGHRDG
jgi:hypothetical protein